MELKTHVRLSEALFKGFKVKILFHYFTSHNYILILFKFLAYLLLNLARLAASRKVFHVQITCKLL